MTLSNELIRIGADEILTVTAESQSYGTVWQEGTSNQWTVSAKSPLNLGAGLYRIETVKGNITHTVASKTVAALATALPSLTNITYAQRVIQTAINKETKMPSLHDKFKGLVDKAHSIPGALANRADSLAQRLDAVSQRGHGAFDGLDSLVTDAEAGVQAAEDAVNQLTNGAPPLQPTTPAAS